MAKVAVLGTGSIGARHLEVLRTIGAQPIAVPLRPIRRTELASAGYACADSLEAARDKGATATIIATATGRHAADVQHALELGLHVLSEKPLATSVGEAKDLPALASSCGLRLFVAYCLRFDEGLLAFRNSLQDMGETHSVRVECRSYLPDWRPGRDHKDAYSSRPEEGGVMMDLSHEIDYAAWLFGPVDVLMGECANLGRLDIEADEMAEALWKTRGGVRVSVALDYITRSPVRFVRAAGHLGELTYDFVRGVLWSATVDNASKQQNFSRRHNAMYEAQDSEFLRAVQGEQPKALADASEALNVLKVCEAWRRSAKSGQRERVE